MLSFTGFYLGILVEASMTIARVTKVITVVYYHTQACFYFISMFDSTLGGPLLVYPIGVIEDFCRYLLLLFFAILDNQLVFSWWGL